MKILKIIKKFLKKMRMTKNQQDTASETQKRVFTKWMNSKLKTNDHEEVEDIYTDLKDGVKLNHLLQTISGHVYRFNRIPKILIKELENFKIFFGQCDVLEINLINCGAEDVREGNEKIILGLIFSLITKSQYFVHNLGKNVDIQNEILSWVRAIAADYQIPSEKVSNFNTDWKDGLLFNCILDKYDSKNCGPFKDCLNEKAIKNLKKAFTNAEEFHSIPRLLEPEDLIEAHVPDSKIVFAYVSEYYNKFKGVKIEEQNSVDFTTYQQGNWIKNQSNDYQRYVNRFKKEISFIKNINTELKRDMLKIEEKFDLKRRAQELAENSAFKLTAVYSNINDILEFLNMPKFETEDTPEKLLEEFTENNENLLTNVIEKEDNLLKEKESAEIRVKESFDIISTETKEDQITKITELLQNPENDSQRRGLARRLRVLQDLKNLASSMKSRIKKASKNFDAADLKKTGFIKQPEYIALSKLLGREPKLTNDKISKKDFLSEIKEEMIFMEVEFKNLNLEVKKE